MQQFFSSASPWNQFGEYHDACACGVLCLVCGSSLAVYAGSESSQIRDGRYGLKIYQHISDIYCDNDINDDNSGNPVSLEKSISFYFYPK